MKRRVREATGSRSGAGPAQRLAEAAAWPYSAFDDELIKRMEQYIWAVEQCPAAGLDWDTVERAICPLDAEVEVATVERAAQALLARMQPGMAPPARRWLIL